MHVLRRTTTAIHHKSPVHTHWADKYSTGGEKRDEGGIKWGGILLLSPSLFSDRKWWSYIFCCGFPNSSLIWNKQHSPRFIVAPFFLPQNQFSLWKEIWCVSAMSLKPISHPSCFNCSYKQFLIEKEESVRGTWYVVFITLGSLPPLVFTVFLQIVFELTLSVSCTLLLPFTCPRVIKLSARKKLIITVNIFGVKCACRTYQS